MGFEQLKYSPPQSAASQQQSPGKHKLISHSNSKQEDKKPLRSYQFGSSADHLVIYVFAVRTKKELKFHCNTHLDKILAAFSAPEQLCR